MTFKETVLQFVEANGPCRFTDIQRFAVDFRLGEGTYDKGYKIQDVHLWDSTTGETKIVSRKQNIHRGMYCSYFYSHNPFWLRGRSYLKKRSDGLYETVRSGPNAKKVNHPVYWQNSYTYED